MLEALRYHPFFGIWFNAGVRNLAVGVGIAGVATGLFVGIRQLTAEDLHHPSQWLTEAEQEELADLMTQLPTEYAWRAGCVWEKSARDFEDVVDVPGGFESFHLREPSGREMSFAAVPKPSSGSYREVEGRGYFCWVPD